MRKIIAWTLVMLLALACVSELAIAEAIPVTGVTITPATLRVKLDETATLTAVVEPADATNPALVWTSDNETVLTVDQNGLLSPGVTTGRARVTVTTVDGGFTASCEVTVAPWTPPFTTFVSAYATTVEKNGKLAPCVRLSWLKSPARISGYQLRRSETPDGKQVIIKSGKIFSCEDTRLVKPGKTYYYHVYVYKTINGIRTYAEPSPAAVVTPLDKPAIAKIQAMSGKRVFLQWNKVDGAQRFDVYRSTNKNLGYEKIATTSAKMYVDTDKTLVPGMRYYYRVAASRYEKAAGGWIYGMPSNALGQKVR